MVVFTDFIINDAQLSSSHISRFLYYLLPSFPYFIFIYIEFYFENFCFRTYCFLSLYISNIYVQLLYHIG